MSEKRLNRDLFGRTYSPLREAIVRAIDADERGYKSPKELSREFGEGLSQVSYHVTVLREIGAIEQVKSAPRRGAIEHYYALRPGILIDATADEAVLDRVAAALCDGAKLTTIRKIVAETGRRVQ